MLGTILIVILILMLLGALPTWPHSRAMGVLSQRWTWIGPCNFSHPAADGSDLIYIHGPSPWYHVPQTLPSA